MVRCRRVISDYTSSTVPEKRNAYFDLYRKKHKRQIHALTEPFPMQ